MTISTVVNHVIYLMLTAAESCCVSLGSRVIHEEILDLLIPRVRGEVPGGDTFSQSKLLFIIFYHGLYWIGLDSIVSGSSETFIMNSKINANNFRFKFL